MPEKIKPSEFAAKIKAKYPVYKDVDDSSLVAKIVDKYPYYKETIDFSATEKAPTAPTVTAAEVPKIDVEGAARAQAIPSFKDYAASRGMGILDMRAAAEGTRGPDLAMKAKMEKDIAEAPERKRVREEKERIAREKAIVNTTTKKLTNSGIKFTEGDAVWKKSQDEIRNAIGNDELALSVDATGNPVYKRKYGFFESYWKTLQESLKDEAESESFVSADINEKVKMADETLSKDTEGVAQWFPEVMAGATIPVMQATVGGMAGTALAPGAGTAAGILGSIMAMSPSAYNKGYKSTSIQMYQKEINEIKAKKGTVTDKDKIDAMGRATTQGVYGGIGDVAFGAGLVLIPAGNAAAGAGLRKALVNFGKHTAMDASKQAILGMTIASAKDVAASASGYNVSAAESINNVIQSGKAGVETAVAFSAYHAAGSIPKYVNSAAKNYLSTVPRLDLNNMSKTLESKGVIPEGATDKMNADLDNFQKSKSAVPDIVPEEDMGSFAGLVEKKNNLVEQKKTSDASFHPKIDEQISAIDERLKKMQESKDPVIDEVDELTGDTGEAEPHTEEVIKKSVEMIEPTEEEVKAAESQKRLDRISEIESIISNDDATFYETGNRPLLKEARLELQAELEALKAQQGIPKKKTSEEVDSLKEASFNEAGEKSKNEQSPKYLGDFIIDNSQVGDRIKINEDQYFEVVSRKTTKKGYIEVELQQFVRNEDTGEFENNPSAIKIFTDKYRGTDLEKLGYKDASDLFENSYTDSSGKRIIEQSVYQTKKSIEDASQTSKESEIKQEVERLKAAEKPAEVAMVSKEVAPEGTVEVKAEAPVEVPKTEEKPAEAKPMEVEKKEGAGGMVKFAEGVEIPYKYKVIEAEQVKPSHLPSGERNPEHTIALAQPKERGDIQSKLAQEKIAASPNLREVGESPNPYFGAPVVNARGEVIQGNNRSLGLKRHYNEGGTSYKKQLADNAEKFGMTREQVEGMKNPVLVRESPIDDAMAIELGNYDVKDLETGGKQRIDPITTVRKMTPEDKNKLAAIIFDGEYSTIKEAIRDNQQQVGSIISKQINAAQRNTIFDKEGNINPKGMEDIENIVNNMLFESGPAVLPEAFTELSYNQQKNIQKAIKHIFNTPEGASILPEVQNAVLGLYDFRKSGIDNFNAWLAQADIFEGKTPRDIFSPVEIKIMETLNKAKNQSELSKQMSAYAELVKGKPADMFEPERAGISKAEAIKKTFNVEYADVTKGYAEPEGKTPTEGAILAEEPRVKIEGATEAEQSDFDSFTKRELARPEFDAEYRAERVAGESKDAYIRRKYCP